MATKRTTFSESKIDAVNNTSSLTIQIYFSAQNSTTWFQSSTLYCNCNGESQSQTVSHPRGGSVNASFTFNDIKHKDDGKMEVYWNWWCTTGTAGLGTQSDAGNKPLTTIPRASSVELTDKVIGLPTKIKVKRANTSFKHTLSYEFGSLSGEIATDVETEVDWTIPDDFYYEKELENSPKANLKIKCITFNGDTQIGEKKQDFEIICSESECIPELGGSILDINNQTIDLSGNSSILIKYASTARIQVVAEGKKGATIKSITVDNVPIDLQKGYLDIEKADKNSFEVIAIDSRGFEKHISPKIDNFIEYISLTLAVNGKRLSPTSDRVNFELSGNFFNGNFGLITNNLQLQFRAVENGQNIEDVSWNDITPTIKDNTFNTIITVSNFNYEKSYLFQFKVVDSLNEPITRTFLIYKGNPIAYFSKDAFNVVGDLNVEGNINFVNPLRMHYDGDNGFGEISIDPNTDTTADKAPTIILSDGESHVSNQTKITSKDIVINNISHKIEEITTNGIGTYIKYGNGILESYQKYRFDIERLTRDGDGTFYIGLIDNIPFPIEFNTVLNVQTSVETDLPGRRYYASFSGVTNSQINSLNLINYWDSTENKGYIHIHVFGKWK